MLVLKDCIHASNKDKAMRHSIHIIEYIIYYSIYIIDCISKADNSILKLLIFRFFNLKKKKFSKTLKF